MSLGACASSATASTSRQQITTSKRHQTSTTKQTNTPTPTMLSTRRISGRRRNRTTALVAVAVAALVTATVAPISATAAAINVVRSDDASPSLAVFAKRAADINAESVNKIKGSTVPQGPILLVLCALAVAFLCLVFVVIKVVVPGSTLASGKKITEERARAKTVLRIRGAAGSIRADRRAMTNTTDSSLNSMSESALKSDAGFKTVVPHFNQHDDRSDSTPSSSSSSDVGKSYPFMRQGVARQSSLNHQQQRSARPPPRPTANRTSTLFRGTDLNISRQPSNPALHQVASNSSSTRAAPPMQQHAHNNSGDFYSPSQSPSQSRRNSDVNLLLDSTPVSQHPLLPSGRRPQHQHHNYQQQPQLAPADSRSRAANRYADIEHAPVEDARPGQFHQPVAQGNGRRGRPGSIVGQSGGGGGVNGSGVPDGYPMSMPGGF